jgi:hypothetical protein
MFCFATWVGGNEYDALVWASEADSVNDDGANATARKTVTVNESDIEGSIRKAMGLTDADEVELN